MRIAFSTDSDLGLESPISHHFGRCPHYVLIDVENQAIQSITSVVNPFVKDHKPGMIPEFIQQQSVDVMVSGGMGRRAYGFFQQYGIQVATGAQGSVQQALDDFNHGTLHLGEPSCGGGGGGHHHHDGGACHSSKN